MQTIVSTLTDIKDKCVAIVSFGPPTSTDGFRPGTYFQVTIDPQQISPTGDYIRFGNTDGDELVGWQRVEALTVVEILGKWEGDEKPTLVYGTQGGVTMMVMD